jgi:hypothetical protein
VNATWTQKIRKKPLDPVETEIFNLRICALAHFAKMRAQEGTCSFLRKCSKCWQMSKKRLESA